MKNTGFVDPIAVKNKSPKEPSKSPWDFSAPAYDDRSGRGINAGADYGVGYKQPVGTKENKKNASVPYGRMNTLNIYE